MFLKQKLLLSLYVSIVLGGVFYCMTRYKASSQCNEIKQEQKASSLSLQHRHGGEKELWISENNTRLYWKILSPQSELLLSHQKGKSSFIEMLHPIRLWMQEKLTKETQEIRYLKASEGSFNYSLLRLDTKKALIEAYETKGNTFHPFDPPHVTFMKGLAEEASLFFEKNRAIFEAKGFSAYIQPEKNL